MGGVARGGPFGARLGMSWHGSGAAPSSKGPPRARGVYRYRGPALSAPLDPADASRWRRRPCEGPDGDLSRPRRRRPPHPGAARPGRSLNLAPRPANRADQRGRTLASGSASPGAPAGTGRDGGQPPRARSRSFSGGTVTPPASRRRAPPATDRTVRTRPPPCKAAEGIMGVVRGGGDKFVVAPRHRHGSVGWCWSQ